MTSITVQRTRLRVLPDASRVLARPFLPGEELLLPGVSRGHSLMARVLAIPDEQVDRLMQQLLLRFAARHYDFEGLLQKQFELVSHYVPSEKRLSPQRKALIGAYFTHEYSIEAAALFNPSIVLAPNQAGVGADEKRVILSLRAVGEGHLSSIEFRSGVLDATGNLRLDAAASHLVSGHRTAPPQFDKAHFHTKLHELNAVNDLSSSVLDRLAPKFTLDELQASLNSLQEYGPPHAIWFETVKIIRILASSNYVTTFPESSALSERVLFPAGPNETRGMEDARFVRFTEQDGSIKYYATYTAYDGFQILPQLIETEDFRRFTISTLNGAAAQNKGMALFPRRVHGKYVMLSRKDRENLHLSMSSEVHNWNQVTELYRPQAPWELLNTGNCGSPIETEAGWLVLTHGVGPMRTYVIGALLLDLNEPGRIIGHLPEPLMEPDESEREGYVPNVLYTCGAMVHGDWLIMPYGFSDSGVALARISMPELLQALLAGGPL